MQGFFFEPPLDSNFWGHIMAEVWKDRVYAPYIEGKKLKTCVEIGANLGIVSYYFSQHFDQVYALEPSKQHYDLLVKNTQGNGLTNVLPINKAVYIENGKFPFGGPTNNKTMRSLHTATWQDGKPDETVETITLDKLFKDNKIEHVDLMKIDCEGSEYEILGGEGFTKVADKIDLIIGEVHSWANRNRNQLNESLKNRGFEVTQLPNDADIFVARRKS